MTAHSPAAAPLNQTPKARLVGRFALLLAACVVLGGVLAIANPNYRWSDRRELPYGADFLQEWVAGDLILSGRASAIYDPVAFASRQHDAARVGFTWPEEDFYPAVYPPVYYCFVAPMAALPYWAAAPAWLALMLMAYVAGVWLIERSSASHQPRRATFVFWCIALVFPALFMGLVMGQKGTLWFLVTAASWQLWRHEKAFTAGCLWGLLVVKPTLCFLLPVVMLAHRQWRFSAGVAVGAVTLCACSALLIPSSLWSDYWQVVVGSTSYQAHDGYRSGWSVSLWSFLRASGYAREVTLGLAMLVGSVLLLALWRWPATHREPLHDPEFLLRILMTTSLLSPHFYFYDLVWLLVPLHGLMQSQPRRALIMTALLWLSILAVQSSDQGPPLLSAVLLLMLAYSTWYAANCGISFAISERVMVSSP